MKRRRALLLSITVVLALCVACGWWLHRERQQYRLNRQLIAALEEDGDTKQALALVNAGANPDTRYEATPAPSLKLLFVHLLRQTRLPTNDSPTAFSIACGESSASADGTRIFLPVDEDPALLKTMLMHGANVSAKGWNGETPLHDAVGAKRRRTVELLLQHGANINAQTQWGQTPLMLPLMFAPPIGDRILARLLLSHGANPNVQDGEGGTALKEAISSSFAKDVISDLLVHGANPNLSDKYGNTPLTTAQWMNRPNIVRLLKQHGAK